ncbi:hypothetical protein AN958_11900 [Leucoagaricus sp. SymC.cos]|nr:hypothetical protein AN958_11900 [Leucoagaricus sp. SymC.cos]
MARIRLPYWSLGIKVVSEAENLVWGTKSTSASVKDEEVPWFDLGIDEDGDGAVAREEVRSFFERGEEGARGPHLGSTSSGEPLAFLSRPLCQDMSTREVRASEEGKEWLNEPVKEYPDCLMVSLILKLSSGNARVLRLFQACIEEEDSGIGGSEERILEKANVPIVAEGPKQEQRSGENKHASKSKTKKEKKKSLEKQIQEARKKEIQAYFQMSFQPGDDGKRARIEKELEAQWQKIREQAKVREKRAKRAQAKQEREAKTQNGAQPPTLTKKQLKKAKREEKRLAKQKKKMEEQVELTRLRQCERELIALKALQTAGLVEASKPDSSPPLAIASDEPAQLPETSNRIKLLQRAREEQVRQQEAEEQYVPDDSPTTSSLKEESTELRRGALLDHVVVNEEGIQESANEGCITLQKAEGADQNGEFHFELVVDLKRLGTSRTDESEKDPLYAPDGNVDVVPTITKVAIALESTTECHISVCGERKQDQGTERRD